MGRVREAGIGERKTERKEIKCVRENGGRGEAEKGYILPLLELALP